jgi:dihydrofolate reductase
MISIIVATSTNLVIGKDNDLPWHLPSDLKRFKELTTGKRVIMGRKCWESIPEKYRPLPNRENIVFTRDLGYVAEGAIVMNKLNMVIEGYKRNPASHISEEHMVIGGAEIYKKYFPVADKLYLTEIWGEIEGDTYLEGFNREEWDVTYVSNPMEENGFKFNFKEYTKKLAID